MNRKHPTSSTQGIRIGNPSPINLVEEEVQTPSFPLESEPYDTSNQSPLDFQWKDFQLDFLPFSWEAL